MVLHIEKENRCKRMKRMRSKICKILTEVEDQDEVLKMLWQIDLGEEICTEKWKNIWNKNILKYMSVRKKEKSINWFGDGI